MILEIDKLCAGYIKGSMVLQDLNLSIAPGDFTALLGRNGMGKTTLMRSIVGQIRPSSGSIRYAGNDITGASSYKVARAGIGYVPQGREIFPDFTVEENLRMGLLGKPGLGKTVPDWAYDIFPILKERRSQQAGTMSGGQQQQLAIMRALLGQPDLLILDEPSEGIQPSIVHDIGVALKDYASEHGLTVLLVEQNLDLVGLLGHHAFFMENGAIVERIDDMARLQNDSELIARYLSV